ncbi:hypothetical protein ACFP8W_00925 [Nocardioides hankookensis]
MSAPRKGQSRPATGRPRKIAGRTTEPVEPASTDGEGGFEAQAPGRLRTSTTDAPVVEDARASDAPVVEVRAERASKPPRRRLTWILVAVIAVLALVGIGEIVYLARDPDPTVSASRPVVTGDLSHRAAVEAAARSTEQILSTSYQDYDGQVDKATEKMTDTFAKEYRATADGIKDDFIAQQTKLQVKAVAQGVVQASPVQVQALLFLNQYVEKQQDGQPKTSYAQYRALVTVVHTDQGWLVSNIETQ